MLVSRWKGLPPVEERYWFKEAYEKLPRPAPMSQYFFPCECHGWDSTIPDVGPAWFCILPTIQLHTKEPKYQQPTQCRVPRPAWLGRCLTQGRSHHMTEP